VDEHDQVVLAPVGDGVVDGGLAEDDRLDVRDLQRPPRSISRIVDYTPDCLQSQPVPDGSPVHCTIDLDGPGKQVGRLEVPRSTNTSGWSHQFVPIVSICGGNGPTAVVFGGVHGDEPEGQVAALRLARETEPGDVPGRIIVVPCASPEASLAYTRLWPSGANLNRSFPGSPDGPPDQQLADFITRFMFPRADVVVDMHSGGRGSICPPWSEMHMVDDAEQRRQMVEGMLAWNTDFHFVYIDVAGSGLLVGEAERQGKIVVSTELGGGGQVTAATHRVAQSGLANVLRHFGVLAGEVVTRDGERTIARATDDDCYVFAPESGLWETFVDVTERVERGQPLGQIHFIERPDREPTVVTAAMAGVVCSIRAIATTTQGDKLAVVGREVTAEDLL
jgi:N-alpha-acetyl-L-2,4-diaminobutyrate deacetylase